MHICPDELGLIGTGIAFLGVGWRYCRGRCRAACSCIARMVRR